MSTHTDLDMPSREELIASTARPMPRMFTVVSAIFAIIGALVFIIGAFKGESRAWQALHFNWLFFATVSQAGVVFVAVQRITTARWSRPVVRLLEGYVAFLPVAFLLLVLIFLGGEHVFPWAQHEVPIAEKAFYLDYGFVATRDLVMFGIMTLLSEIGRAHV